MGMQREALHCVKCGEVLDYRLGQYECPGCGHTQLAAPPAVQASRPQAGAGSWDPGAQYRQAPPAAAPPPYAPGGYSAGGRPGGPPFGPAAAAPDPLRQEKLIFLGVHGAIVLWGILGIAGVLGGGWSGPPNPDELVVNEAAREMSAMAGGLIGWVLAAGTLLLRETWLEWTCLSCTGCGVLGGIGVLALAGGVLAQAGLGGPALAQSGLQVASNVWLLTLLWRDIQGQAS
jgi:hypothetical protein